MKLMQRDVQLITYKSSGLWDEPGICNSTVSVSVGQDKQFTLMGLSVKYELYCDSQNGLLEFEMREFFAIDLENKKATPESLYYFVEQASINSYAILLGESLKKGRGAPPKPALKQIEIITALRLELDEYYSLS
jgi:hypothetical protein